MTGKSDGTTLPVSRHRTCWRVRERRRFMAPSSSRNGIPLGSSTPSSRFRASRSTCSYALFRFTTRRSRSAVISSTWGSFLKISPISVSDMVPPSIVLVPNTLETSTSRSISLAICGNCGTDANTAWASATRSMSGVMADMSNPTWKWKFPDRFVSTVMSPIS